MAADLGIRWYFSRGDTSLICNAGGIKEVEVIKEVPVETCSEKIVTNAIKNNEPYVLGGIDFNSNSNKLSNKAKIILDNFSSISKLNSKAVIDIIDYTKNKEKTLNNLVVKKRVDTIRNYFISKGITNLKINYYDSLANYQPSKIDNKVNTPRVILNIYESEPEKIISEPKTILEPQKTSTEKNILEEITGITFEVNSDKLTTESKAILIDAANKLSKFDTPFEIHGYTDSDGTAKYNKNLSERRAMSVKNFLISQGISADRMTTFGHGEENPIADNSTPAGKALNRRMEFKLPQYFKGIKVKKIKNTTSEITDSSNNLSIDKIILSSKAQKMEIDLLKNDKLTLTNLRFVFNKDILVEESKQLLIDLTNVLKKHPNIKIRIEGHTDNIGSDDYNQYLSIMRANAVKKYLIEHGISKYRLTTKGFGESSPIADNSTEKGRAQNRRIEFKVVK